MTEVKKRSPLNTLWGFLKTHKVLIAVMFASELLISAVSVVTPKPDKAKGDEIFMC